MWLKTAQLQKNEPPFIGKQASFAKIRHLLK